MVDNLVRFVVDNVAECQFQACVDGTVAKVDRCHCAVLAFKQRAWELSRVKHPCGRFDVWEVEGCHYSVNTKLLSFQSKTASFPSSVSGW